ncbi:MAG: (Fe-S)-binding protein, partial [Longimicrobiales bacterium]
ARLLFEMLQGDVVTDGWRSEAVKQALDLCLACKGCKRDCPVTVDMATYKAEFLAHYYERRLRPRHAYAFGLIYWWARLGSRVPTITNFVSGAPVLSALVKGMAGIAPERAVPRFAGKSFRRSFRKHRGRNPDGPTVILWPDTFTNFFHPWKAEAAVEVLEAAGFDVRVPDAPLCCGRPLYDFGMLDLAKRQLRQILDALRAEIRAGVPIVGLEPSCVSTFRDELPNLLPDDRDAARLKEQTYMLSEFLDRQTPRFAWPTLTRRALVHGHCHHRSVLDWSAETRVLNRMGVDYKVLDSGCCGMAGSFGFEADHYSVSQACAERVLLPRLREAPPETLVITDGFSCNEQIEQNLGRRALHLAEVIRLGLAQGEAAT